jgi:hypothetical protein
MSLAAASGEPTAAKVVADYAAQMKPEQVQQAQLLVRGMATPARRKADVDLC